MILRKHVLIGVLAFLGLLVVGLTLFTAGTDTVNTLTEEEAIELIMLKEPRLQGFTDQSLPPRVIEAERSEEGWFVAFTERGSGIDSVLGAECYFVANDKTITSNGTFTKTGDVNVQRIDVTTCMPQGDGTEGGVAQGDVIPRPYGAVTLSIGDVAVFPDVQIRPLRIAEESRCPADVTCIQAGTVRIEMETISALGTSTDILALGDTLTTEAESITFTSASPYPVEGANIPTSAYELSFTVVKRTDTAPSLPPAEEEPVPPPTGGAATGCYVGGCSSQICSDQPDMVSTCEYREEYACYQNAVCERQPNGICGWTPSETLTQCLVNAE